MKNEKLYNYLDGHLQELLGDGRMSFAITDLRNNFKEYSLNALQMNLKRLNKKKKIKHIMKGFYVIIPPEYQQRKILPAELFIDGLFKYLGRPYYFGLSSAAIMHGASHQQVMESYIIINKPPIRTTKVEGLKINYAVKSVMPKYGIEKRKTDTGYINISGAELTAMDLVEYQNRIGGLNRTATVLFELSDTMKKEKLLEVLNNDISLSGLQRLGYILDVVLNKKELSAVIKNYLAEKRIFRVALKPNIKKEGFKVHPDWKIIENYKIETDFQ
jgi:predicted transcriptional regulator of viral defense system